MTDEQIPIDREEKTSEDSNERHSTKPEWANWSDIISEAFSDGSDAGTNAADGSAGKFKEMTEKGVYDLTYGLAYALSYGASMVKDSMVNPANSGFQDGTEAGREAAKEARDSKGEEPDQPDFATT